VTPRKREALSQLQWNGIALQCFLCAINNASAPGLMGISRERHTHIFFECRPKCDPKGNAKQRCSPNRAAPIVRGA
jgi:hypothetical protein